MPKTYIDNLAKIIKFDKNDQSLLMSPEKAIERFSNICTKYGVESALISSKYQSDRELWIAGVFVLGLYVNNQKDYWLRRASSNESTPDVYASNYRNPTGTELGVIREQLKIEILEYEKHATTSIGKHIIDKKLAKNYPSEYFILCYVHGHEGETLRPIDVINEIKETSNIGIAEIWVLFNSSIDNADKYTLLRVYPDYLPIDFNYKEIIKQQQQVDFIKESRGTDKIVKFQKLGDAYVPL